MAAAAQQSQVTLLENLPPEILRGIVEICADDVSVGRATLLSLSVMNKYLRNVTASRLLQRIRFRDGPESPGDEILHSIRRFMAAPEVWCHARSISLYLNRLKYLSVGDDRLAEPYHYLILPELFEALAKMQEVTELYMHMDAADEAVCTLMPGDFHHPYVVPNMTQLRIYQTCSDPRQAFKPNDWWHSEISSLDLPDRTPELEYLSLKYVDVTDGQAMKECQKVPENSRERLNTLRKRLPVLPSERLKYIKDLSRNHPLNEDRSKLARKTFDRCAQLRRICFVRSSVGEVYVRGYPGAVADSTGYISHEIHDADMDDIPKAWHHGVPQTGVLPFPGFTPWEGVDAAPGAE
ncbi:hypothetical protein INS49_007823 [Diaporthe citri]|uniref:uncharacterized protein n=1 Tax=Diaporthe citri TaxID=83186 RepID=UPI001C805555|nr:uncharacterized protein INS49_007823 [Diaporthe citri]KAG6362730.1 hypothetical protein INS49_007823 [Diaporthe citri]